MKERMIIGENIMRNWRGQIKGKRETLLELSERGFSGIVSPSKHTDIPKEDIDAYAQR
jgi:hypothetical protein